ncbi:hypothetical protein F2P56_037176 [Juglans regia]|uniref:Ankyrin repeat-containing protein ITN1-like n=1 Tax=Juglans regia TaxID=51240 RepID=A0A833TLJ2_JUGRE|nr:hypothetical protein F2P56_037176 [Juglans regia]
MKLVRDQFQQLLTRMCQAIPTHTSPDNRYEIIAPVIFRGISRGNFEFIYHIVKANSDILLIGDVTDNRSIFQCAILYRQHRIFSLIYSLKKKNILLNVEDASRNTILHMAGMLTEHTPIDHIRGAALQMQREVQWFKEVERICPLSCKERLNKDGLTPKQLFTVNHQKLKEKGEKWMKGTTTSSTVVGALVITITFVAAFTIPGVLTFLGILTARYAEEDFLKSLPKRMIIGLFTLFFSITTMMIAFSAALLLILHGQIWFVAPIIGLAGVPIILFALMQSRLLVDMVVSTYGSCIFNRKIKALL